MNKLTKEEEKIIAAFRRGELNVKDSTQTPKKSKESNVELCRAIMVEDDELISKHLNQVNQIDQFGKKSINYAQYTKTVFLLLDAGLDLADEETRLSLTEYEYSYKELFKLIEMLLNKGIDILDDIDGEIYLNMLLEVVDHSNEYYDDFLPRLADLFIKRNIDFDDLDDNLEALCVAISAIKWILAQKGTEIAKTPVVGDTV